MDLDLRVADEAAERWSARQKEREARRAAIDEGRISDVETPERIKRRVDRLTEATLKRKVERRVAEPKPQPIQAEPPSGRLANGRRCIDLIHRAISSYAV